MTSCPDPATLGQNRQANMRQTIASFWRDHRTLLLAFGATLAVTLYFMVRLIVVTLYWANPAHHDVTIAAWMTPGYIARSYQLAPHVLFEAIGYGPAPGDPRSLRQIADETGRSVDDIAEAIRTAIATARATPPAATP